MINELKTGIAQRLDSTFSGVPIHTEQTEQGLIEPCFFIKDVTSDQNQIVGNRYKQTHVFDVQYFPPLDGSENEHIADTASELYGVLEYLTIDDDQVRGTKMRQEKVDGVLHFMVNYDFTVKRATTPDDPMETIDVDINV